MLTGWLQSAGAQYQPIIATTGPARPIIAWKSSESPGPPSAAPAPCPRNIASNVQLPRVTWRACAQLQVKLRCISRGW